MANVHMNISACRIKFLITETLNPPLREARDFAESNGGMK
jgi:hypothetical protein